MEFPDDWYEEIDGRSWILNQDKVAAEIWRLRRDNLDLTIQVTAESKDKARLRAVLRQIMTLADKAQPTENVLIRIGHIADEALNGEQRTQEEG